MERIVRPFEVKEVTESGAFEGFASTYGNVDLGGDIVEPGAFREFVRTKDGQIRILDHHVTRRPVGKGKETDTHLGLALKAGLNLKVSYARDVHALMLDHTMDGLSIGFDILPGGSEIDEKGIRHLTKLKLWEVSIVTFGMNPSALVSSVKALPQFNTIRECEAWLRDEAGFTNSVAKQFVARFRQVLVDARDEQAPRDEAGRNADVKSVLSILERVYASAAPASK
jgi:Escherichia/Staphylococcus phage prohead protease